MCEKKYIVGWVVAAGSVFLLTAIVYLIVYASGAEKATTPITLGPKPTAAGNGKWEMLRMRFSSDPSYATTPNKEYFIPNPRTKQEAEDEGWQLIQGSGCEGATEKTFWGYRFAPPGYSESENKASLLIYDINGFIAGVQSVVPLSATFNDDYHNFTDSRYYQRDTIDGREVYVTTAYFVDPYIICTKGRSQSDFDKDGTGYALYFQVGHTPLQVQATPLTQNETDGTGWYKHKCVPNMGRHYFMFNPAGDNRTCFELAPLQLIYEDQEPYRLNGFVWQHIGNQTGKRLEYIVSPRQIGGVMVNPPACIINAMPKNLTGEAWERLGRPGVRAQHVYLRNHIQNCNCPYPSCP